MDYWSDFTSTGNLYSYLKYRELKNKQQKKTSSTKEIK